MTERREFPTKVKLAAFERANKRCEVCTALLVPGKYRYDHRIPDALGGPPTLENCVVQCLACDTPKTAADQTVIAKSRRIRAKAAGIATTSRPLMGSIRSGWRKRMDGTVERR